MNKLYTALAQIITMSASGTLEKSEQDKMVKLAQDIASGIEEKNEVCADERKYHDIDRLLADVARLQENLEYERGAKEKAREERDALKAKLRRLEGKQLAAKPWHSQSV
jgi:Cu/Ag efflux pump CusA